MKSKILFLIVSCLLLFGRNGFSQSYYEATFNDKGISLYIVPSRMAISNYDITLLPGQSFTGVRYLFSQSTKIGNFQVNNLPTWLNSVSPNIFTSTGCTDIIPIEFSITAPTSPGVYSYTVIEGNNNWNDTKITLTVTSTPLADTVIVAGDIFGSDTTFQTLYNNGFNAPCLNPYFPFTAGYDIKYELYPSVNWLSVTPDTFTLANSQSQIVSRVFQNSIAGVYHTLESRSIKGFPRPFFLYYEYRVDSTLLSSCNGGWQQRIISANESYSGTPHTGTIHYKCGGSTTIDKPLIIVEGFETGENYGPSAINSDLVTELEVKGYDVIFLDLHQNNGYIQNNAYLLQKLIDDVNNINGVDSIVVFGVSMGGLIARYAIADMEQDGKNHRVKLYGSIDSPHRGANIPLGMQYIGQVLDLEPMKYVNTNLVTIQLISGQDTLNVGQTTTLFEILETLSSSFLNGSNNNLEDLSNTFKSLDELQKTSQSPAARQMLLVQSEDLTILNASNYVHNYDPLPLFDSFMTEYNNLGYPQHCRNIAVSNGSICDDLQLNNTNIKIIDTTIIVDSLNISFLDSITFNLKMQNAGVNTPNSILDVDVIFHFSINILNNPYNFTSSLNVGVMASDTTPRDFIAGGFRNYKGDGFKIDDFSFVAINSAFDVDYDSLGIENPPFDNYIRGEGDNTEHPVITPNIKNWLLAELDGTPFVAPTCGDTLPDLQIVNAVLTPDTAMLKHGDSFTIDIDIKNFGTVTAPQSSMIAYLSDDGEIDGTDLLLSFINVNSLSSNSTENKVTNLITISNAVTLGNKFILIEADANKLILETKDNNNIYKIPITIIDTTNVITPTLPISWEVTATNIKHDIVIPHDVFVSIKGTQIEENDYIGAFYEDNGIVKCGGYAKWNNDGVLLQVNGNDLNTILKEGIDSTEVIQLKVYRLNIQKEYALKSIFISPADDSTATVNATNTFKRNGVSIVDSIYTNDTLLISLTQIWDMISSNTEPQNLNIENILDSIKSKVIILKDINGNTYIPDPFFTVNNIGNWNIRKGYKVKMSQSDTLRIIGHTIIPELSPIDIQQGWQIIPYYPKATTDISTVLATIDIDIDLVKDAFGNT